MVLTGTLSQARSGPALRPAGSSTSAAAARQASARVAGLSQAVGGIPGIRGGSSYHWYAGRAATGAVIAARPLPTAGASPLGRLHQPDVLVVAPGRLPAGLEASIRRMHGVAAALAVDAGRIQVNGIFVNVLGVNPQEFRPFAAGPTARAASLWQDVAAGGMAISYTMGRQDKLSLTKPVRVAGARTLLLPVAGFGTVGIGGVDAVVSDRVARSLGLPQANAIVVSAPTARLDGLIAKIRKRLPAKASVAALVTQVIVGGTTVTTGAAGSAGLTAQQGAGLTASELATFLAAAKSRVGMPYVWGAAGPGAFDCSGLVQWSMAQAGVTMPRVAADQARTGPLLRLSDLRPGDLLFYHTDPTAPGYISHVAIYLGNGQMLQAPEPGMNVEIVPADFGAGFAGAVRVYPAVAAAVAGNPAG
ncbi:MAG TPA: C40 family peptidase [Streptosporangiaceae bacterium]